jgi:16S rRNA (uracil1498-N3)-methyltransferase
MRHVPHLFLEGPWHSPEIELSGAQLKHMKTVLRLAVGSQISYTDGAGVIGEGFLGDRAITRGEERQVDRRSTLVVAVAPPVSRERQRFLVEKLGELGVERVAWMSAKHGSRHVPPSARVKAWAVSALEQSRGAWMMKTNSVLESWRNLEPPVVVCSPGGFGELPRARTVVIGPEGGWAEGEVPDDVVTWNLGEGVLRVETAAVVAAARLTNQ